jgi:hypothetical protein
MDDGYDGDDEPVELDLPLWQRPMPGVMQKSIEMRADLNKLLVKVRSGYIPAYVSEDGPWFVKFNGIDASWNLLFEFTQVNYAFYQTNKDLGLFPVEIAELVIEWLDFRRSTRIAARISIKSDRRRLGNVLARADRLYPYVLQGDELWLPPALD